MRIGLVGGTGREGRGLAVRWARAGHTVAIGSRDEARARERARELSQELASGEARGGIEGGDNAWAIEGADAVVLSVPYAAHAETLEVLAKGLVGRLVIDITVPLRPPRVQVVQLPPGQSAALEARALLGPEVRLVAALHHVSSVHLGDPSHAIDCDVLVCGDDEPSRAAAIALIEDLGVRAIDAGPLQNAIALEALTPVLLHINRRYKNPGVGLRITGLLSETQGGGVTSKHGS
jgi:NADPH-dependent F420 reductase